MFTCSDASQQEIVDDIQGEELDALVIASCSPTLHRFTFRGVAKRAGLNPYQYIQVNLREQCSWAHTDNLEYATEKAILMVKAGIAKARYTEPLEEIRINTVGKVLVIGAGISGLRAALALSRRPSASTIFGKHSASRWRTISSGRTSSSLWRGKKTVICCHIG